MNINNAFNIISLQRKYNNDAKIVFWAQSKISSIIPNTNLDKLFLKLKNDIIQNGECDFREYIDLKSYNNCYYFRVIMLIQCMSVSPLYFKFYYDNNILSIKCDMFIINCDMKTEKLTLMVYEKNNDEINKSVIDLMRYLIKYSSQKKIEEKNIQFPISNEIHLFDIKK